MTVLNLHKEERLKIAKEILNKNIKNPIVVKGTTYKEGEALLIFVNGKVLAEKLKLTVKNELEKSDLSNKYLVELDFDNSNLDNNSLYFEKIMDSSIFYRIPSIIDDSEDEEKIQELKKFVETVIYSSKELETVFEAVELDVKMELEKLDLMISSSTQTEYVLYDLLTDEMVDSFQQQEVSKETSLNIPIELTNKFRLNQFERKLEPQFLSKKEVTVKYNLPKYSNHTIVGIVLNAISNNEKQIIEYQTLAELNAEQSSFVNWAKMIVGTVDDYIRQFNNFYYKEEELKDMIR